MSEHDEEEILMVCRLDERSCRALLFAIEFTYKNWTGQGELDQEQLYKLKPSFQGMLLEFNLLR